MNPPRDRHAGVRSRLGTEFGETLRMMVLETPGAIAGVLSDDRGDAVDYAYDPADIDDLDVQLLAAQLGQPLLRLRATAEPRGLHDPIVLVETPTRALLACSLHGECIAAMLLQRQSNVGRALGVFERGRGVLDVLLE